MSFSDETLMAYADGELDAATRAAVEAAMRADPSIARRVARLRARRDEGYIGGLGPEPGRAARERRATVVQLDVVRAHRAAVQLAARKAAKRSWGWPEWGALVAVLLLGLVAGKVGLARWQPGWLSDAPPPTLVASRDGMLLAQGRLAAALSQQMGGAAPNDGEIRIGLSFLSNQGGYCRTFTLAGANQDLSGIACRSSEQWQVPALVQNARPLTQMGPSRMAGVEMPGAVMEAIDQRIVGGMLDPRAELEALRRGWQR